MATASESGAEGTGVGWGLGALLDRWQRDRDAEAIDALVHRIRVPLERVVAHALRRRGIRDPGACDDAIALVFEHLCRLTARAGGTTSTRFDSARGPPGADPGWAYVLCLARSRARDVARSRRRRDRRMAALMAGVARAGDPVSRQDAPGDEIRRLLAAVASLDERSRTVIELLLAGKNQAVIAHVLGVCEGTVSRIRARAIAELQAVLAE